MDNLTQRDTALRIYFDATDTIRHHDGERMATHRIAVAVISSLLAFTSSKIFANEAITLPLSILGLVVCLTFHAISKKYEGLVLRERSKARAAREVLKALGDEVIASVDTAKRESSHQNPAWANFSLQSLWSVFYLLLAIAFIFLGAREAIF